MSHEAGQLRKALLDLEPATPAIAENLSKEIPNMFDKKLTRNSRIWWTISLVASLIFMAWGTFVLLITQIDIFLRIVWGIYTVGNLAFAVFAITVLVSGVLRLRRLYALFGAVSPGGSLLCTVLLIARAAVNPSLEALLWSLLGILCVIVAFAWMLFNRITAAELGTREQLLRMELRLFETTTARGK